MARTTQSVLYFVYEQYTKKLTDLLVPVIYEGFATIWNRVKEKYEKQWGVNYAEKFQKRLAQIPHWNGNDIKIETDRIRAKLNCSFLEKLVEKAFLLKTQILSTINESDTKIKVTIPSLENFIHQCYLSSSKDMLLNPQVMEDREGYISYDEKLTRIKLAFEIIRQGILMAVRDMLPLDQLLTDSTNSHQESGEHEQIQDASDKHQEVVEIAEEQVTKHEKLDPFERELRQHTHNFQ